MIWENILKPEIIDTIKSQQKFVRSCIPSDEEPKIHYKANYSNMKKQAKILQLLQQKRTDQVRDWENRRLIYMFILVFIATLGIFISSVLIPLNLEYFNFGYYWLFGYIPLLIISCVYCYRYDQVGNCFSKSILLFHL